MKEFNLDATDIFVGISPKRVNNKNKITLEKCHNLEPVDGDYDLHETVVDMDSDGFDWGNA
jgi:hypothetical protein